MYDLSNIQNLIFTFNLYDLFELSNVAWLA